MPTAVYITNRRDVCMPPYTKKKKIYDNDERFRVCTDESLAGGCLPPTSGCTSRHSCMEPSSIGCIATVSLMTDLGWRRHRKDNVDCKANIARFHVQSCGCFSA